MNECTCSEDLSGRPTYESPPSNSISSSCTTSISISIWMAPRAVATHFAVCVAVAASVAASVAIVSGECCFCGCVSLQGVFMFLPLVVCRFCATLSLSHCFSVCVCVGNELAANNISVLAIMWRPPHKWLGHNSPLALTFSHFTAEWASSC